MTFNCFPSCLMCIESMEITINTYRCYERSKQCNDTSHISSLKVTVSHVIVILSVLPCQLSSKSNSHISRPLLRLYISQCIFQCIQYNFNFVQQCIQISTRINSSMYIRTSVFVQFETYPIFNRDHH